MNKNGTYNTTETLLNEKLEEIMNKKRTQFEQTGRLGGTLTKLDPLDVEFEAAILEANGIERDIAILIAGMKLSANAAGQMAWNCIRAIEDNGGVSEEVVERLRHFESHLIKASSEMVRLSHIESEEVVS
jgi:hypothetical protein